MNFFNVYLCITYSTWHYGSCSVGKTQIENELSQTLKLIQTKWV